MIRGYLSLGSNLGDRQAHLRDALTLLAQGGATILKASHIYESAPAEVDNEQGDYLNMVVEVSFDGGPIELLDCCMRVEDVQGRIRPYHNAPRTIDIDVLLIEGVEVKGERLVVPHPKMERRAFVIYPLAEIEPGLILPSGRKIGDVKKDLKDDETVMVRDCEYG